MGKHAFNDIRKNKSKKFTPVMINNFSWSDKHDSRNSLEQSYYCHRYQVTKHVLLSMYANFRFFAFLLKSFSVLKVSKSTILFQ